MLYLFLCCHLSLHYLQFVLFCHFHVFIAAVPTPENIAQQVLASFYAINIFGDERDDVLKKWNMLQACWGTGKGYYNPTQPPIEYNNQNPFYRFKAIGYTVIPSTDNSEGMIRMWFNKKDSELR